MAARGRARGPVGQSAAKLKDALTSKLSRSGDRVDQALNASLLKALGLVTAFLEQEVEQESALELLKEEVKHILLTASQAQARSKASSAPASQCSSQPPAGRPLFPHLPHKGAARAAAQRHAQEQKQLPGRRSADQLPPASEQLSSAGGSAVSKSAEVDWTLPQRLLQTKAFVHSHESVFDRMILKQDELAQAAEAERKRQVALGKQRTKSMYDEQMEGVRARREAEAQAKARERDELQDLQRRLKEEEKERKQREEEAQSRMRQVFKGQVDEVHGRRQQEQQQRVREAQLERLKLEEEERREQARKEELARTNKELREQAKRELEASLAWKARALMQQQEDEKKAVKEAEEVMAAKEARRLSDIAQRAERQKKTFERAGGVAMIANLKEQARIEAERTERLRLEREAKEDAAAAERKARKESIIQQQVQALKQQMALQEAEKQREAEAQRKLKAQLDEQLEREKREDKERKQQLRKSKEQQLLELKASVVQDHKRRHDLYASAIPEADSWVHAGVMQGRDRGFANLTVPKSFLAAVKGTEGGPMVPAHS